MGRKSIFKQEDLDSLSQYSPTSNEFNDQLQKILASPRETKKTVSKKTINRLSKVITKLRNGNETPKKKKSGMKSTVDLRMLAQEIIQMKLSSNSLTKEDIKVFVKEKFKRKCGGKSPHRSTVIRVLKQIQPDIDTGYSLLKMQADGNTGKGSSATVFDILVTQAEAVKEVEPYSVVEVCGLDEVISTSSPVTLNMEFEKEGLTMSRESAIIDTMDGKLSSARVKRRRAALSTKSVTSEVRDSKELMMSRVSAVKRAKKDIFRSPVLSTTSVASEVTESKTSTMSRTSKVNSSRNENRLSMRIRETLGRKGTLASPMAVVLKAVSQKRKLSCEVSTNKSGRKDSDECNIVINPRSYHETIKKARVLLSPGEQPRPVGREEIMKSITNTIVNSLRFIQRGTLARPRKDVDPFDQDNFENNDDVANLYICGSPGTGKTLCIDQVLRNLDATLEEDLSRPVYNVIRLQGTTLQTTNEFFSVLATRLEVDLRGRFKDPRSAVLSLFRSQTGQSTCRTRAPTTILFIDEIDRAPTNAVKDVLEIAATAYRELEKDQEQLIKRVDSYCNVIVIGAANDRLFCENVGLSYGSQQRIFRYCFEPYTNLQLFNILQHRTEGLFDKTAMSMLSMKVNNKSGDVRLLLQLADKILTETTKMYRRQIEQRDEHDSCTDITRIPLVKFNPLESWDSQVTEITPFVLLNHVTTVCKEIGHGPAMQTTDVMNNISGGARALVVAMICYGKTDTTSSLKGFSLPSALNARDIRQSLQTYIEIKAQLGVKIGHDPSEANVSRWIEELHCQSIIDGGEITLGSSRSYCLNREHQAKTKFTKWRIRVEAINILRYRDLENVHKNSLESYLEEKQKQKDSLVKPIDI